MNFVHSIPARRVEADQPADGLKGWSREENRRSYGIMGGMQPSPLVIIMMGVSGCGKTTIGRLVAARLGWAFFDGDDFHPPQNVARMARGEPLTDEDRAGWLTVLGELLAGRLAAGEPAVLACSALKASYRARLHAGDPRVALVYLRGSYELIYARLTARRGHYMPARLLESQFAALEEPADALTLAVDAPPAETAARVLAELGFDPPA